MDPSDPANYFALAKIYEDAGNYEQAEATLLKARDAQPEATRPSTCSWRRSTTARASSTRRWKP